MKKNTELTELYLKIIEAASGGQGTCEETAIENFKNAKGQQGLQEALQECFATTGKKIPALSLQNMTFRGKEIVTKFILAGVVDMDSTFWYLYAPKNKATLKWYVQYLYNETKVKVSDYQKEISSLKSTDSQEAKNVLSYYNKARELLSTYREIMDALDKQKETDTLNTQEDTSKQAEQGVTDTETDKKDTGELAVQEDTDTKTDKKETNVDTNQQAYVTTSTSSTKAATGEDSSNKSLQELNFISGLKSVLVAKIPTFISSKFQKLYSLFVKDSTQKATCDAE